MRGVIGVAALAVVLAASGCGGSESTTGTPEDPASSSEAARTLAETCPLVEKATPTGLAPSQERLAAYAADLSGFVAAGDVETRNALKPVQAAVEATRTAAQGQESLDAFDQWTAAIDTLAVRCNAVGSGAFQG